MSPTRRCDQCGNTYIYSLPHSRFCSADCRARSHYAAKRWEPVSHPPKVCEHCGTDFIPARPFQRFHSNACRNAAYRKRQQSS